MDPTVKQPHPELNVRPVIRLASGLKVDLRTVSRDYLHRLLQNQNGTGPIALQVLYEYQRRAAVANLAKGQTNA